MFRLLLYGVFIVLLYIVILVFDCVSFCLFELFGFKSGEFSNFTEIYLISRIRREDYRSGFRE